MTTATITITITSLQDLEKEIRRGLKLTYDELFKIIAFLLSDSDDTSSPYLKSYNNNKT